MLEEEGNVSYVPPSAIWVLIASLCGRHLLPAPTPMTEGTLSYEVVQREGTACLKACWK